MCFKSLMRPDEVMMPQLALSIQVTGRREHRVEAWGRKVRQGVQYRAVASASRLMGIAQAALATARGTELKRCLLVSLWRDERS